MLKTRSRVTNCRAGLFIPIINPAYGQCIFQFVLSGQQFAVGLKLLLYGNGTIVTIETTPLFISTEQSRKQLRYFHCR